MTMKELQSLIRQSYCALLGVPINSMMVRTTYNTDGQLAFTINDDVVIMSLEEADDMYGNYRQYVERPVGDINYRDHVGTRVWDVRLTAYGPNSHTNLDLIRSGVLTHTSMRILSPKDVFVVPTIPRIQRSPEQFNGQWYERSDMTIRYNELYVYEENVGRTDTVVIQSITGSHEGGNS